MEGYPALRLFEADATMGVMRLFVYSLAIAFTLGSAAGCRPKNPPTNSIKASGTIVTGDGIGDLTIVFTPPDKFRIVGSHPLAGRVIDIGGDGNLIWVVTDQQKTVMKGKIIVDDHETWEPKQNVRSAPIGRTTVAARRAG